MAKYGGWNLAKVMNDDNSLDHDRESIHSFVVTSTTRPLPLSNDKPALSITSHSKARPKGLDSDKLFDLPEEPTVLFPAPRKRKREMTTKSNSCQSPKSSTKLAPRYKLESNPTEPKTLPASGDFLDSLSKSNQPEPFSNADIEKSIGTESAQRGGTFISPNTIVAKSTIDEISTFRFQAHQPSSYHPSDIGSDFFANHPTSPDAYMRTEDYGSASFKNGPLEKPPPVYNVAFASDITHHQDVRKAFQDVLFPSYQIDSDLVGNQDSSIAASTEITDPQLDSDDEFPLDFEDEIAMAQLTVLEKLINTNAPKASEQPTSIYSKLQCEQFDDDNHELSSPISRTLYANSAAAASDSAEKIPILDSYPMLMDGNDCSSIRYEPYQISISSMDCRPRITASPRTSKRELPAGKTSEYMPLPIFARPNFPSRLLGLSPVDGASANPFSRICFRIGELIREGGHWDSLGQETIIELFARVCNSSREAGTSKQIFRFVDLFHDHPPFLNGVLENCKAYGLQEIESRQLIGPEGMGQMVRCIGRIKRVLIGAPGWTFHIINIRATDWEEVRWTKEIVEARKAISGL